MAPTEAIPNVLFAPTRLKQGWTTRVIHELCWRYILPALKTPLLVHAKNRYGVEAGSEDYFQMFSSRPMICAYSSVLAPRPQDYHNGVIGPIGFFRAPARNLKPMMVPEELGTFVEGRPRKELAYVSWGSMGVGSDDALTALAVGALARAGVAGVVQGGYSDLRIEKLSDPALRSFAAQNVFFIEKGASIPHNWLFPKCGACVHHGGIGTLAACLDAGTPMVVTAVFGDQFFWAHRVEEGGVGFRGPPLAEATIDLLGDCLRRCLDDLGNGGQMAAKALAMSEAMKREDAIGAALDFIESTCREGAPAIHEKDEIVVVGPEDKYSPE